MEISIIMITMDEKIMASLNIQNKVTTVVALSLLASVLGECSTVHSPPALLFSFFFFDEEISLCMVIPLLVPGSVHSGSAS